VTDGTTTVEVTTRALPTALFRGGIGVVLAGRAPGPGRFDADEVLVKHSEVYAPLRPGQTPPPGLLEAIGVGAP
jgi:cytochrome c-type biogenesis protein CcmE